MAKKILEKSPAFQFYPADFLADGAVQLMNAEEIGVHILLMCYAWRESKDQCSLPNDINKFACWGRVSEKKFKKISKKVFCAWEVAEDKILQKGLQKQALAQNKRRKKLAKNGRKGGLAKRKSALKNEASAKQEESKSSAKKKQMPSPSSSTASSSSTSINSSKEELQEETEIFFKKEPETNEIPKPEYPIQQVNAFLKVLKKTFGIRDFQEKQPIQREFGEEILFLGDCIGGNEFKRRVKGLLESWKASQLTSIVKSHELIKSYPEENSPLNKSRKSKSETRKV